MNHYKSFKKSQKSTIKSHAEMNIMHSLKEIYMIQCKFQTYYIDKVWSNLAIQCIQTLRLSFPTNQLTPELQKSQNFLLLPRNL